MALAALDREAPVHHRTDRELVHQAPVHADDGHDATVAAAHDRLAQRERPLGLLPHRLLHTVVRIRRPVVVSLHADGVDARVRAAAARDLLQRLRDAVDLLVVQRVDAEVLARDLQPVLEAVDEDHALGA